MAMQCDTCDTLLQLSAEQNLTPLVLIHGCIQYDLEVSLLWNAPLFYNN